MGSRDLGLGAADAATKTPIDPVALFAYQKIEMTPWELHVLLKFGASWQSVAIQRRIEND